MTWPGSPPANILQLRTQVVACASAVSNGLVVDNFHHPRAVITSEDGTAADALPLAVLDEPKSTARRFAETALPSSKLRLKLYAIMDAPTLEEWARTLKTELVKQAPGLAITGIDVGMCSDPVPGALALTVGGTPAGVRMIALDLDCGLKS